MTTRADTTPPPQRAKSAIVWIVRTALWAVAGLLLIAVAAVFVTGASPGMSLFGRNGKTTAYGRPRGSDYLSVQVGWTLAFVLGGGVVLLAIFAMGLATRRRREAIAVLGHVASAIGLGLPLPVYLRRAAAGEAPSLRRRIVRLARGLEAGRPLGDVLATATPDLPPRVIDRVAAAERSFMLGDALAAILRQERRQLSRADQIRPGLGYASVVLGIVLFVTAMINVFVAPKYMQIFADFKAPLPWLTLAVFNGIPAGPTIVLLVGMILVLLCLLARVVRDLFLLRRRRVPLFRNLWDRVAWRLPVVGNLIRARDYAAACEVLDEALRAGRPLPEAIEAATMLSLNVVLRRRMELWRSAVEIGDTTAAAARGAGMPKLLCDLLAAARHDAADAVAFAGRVYAGTARRLTVAIAALTPLLLTGVLATLVFVVALALFRPYVALIEVTRMKVYP